LLGENSDTLPSRRLLDQPDNGLKVRAEANGLGNWSGFTTPSPGDGTDPGKAADRGRLQETPSNNWP
jgi:hypothetical protein